MNTLITSISILFACISFGQDYYSIKSDDGRINYYYPPTIKIELINETGNVALDRSELNEPFTGNYALSIDVPWSTEKEVLNPKRDLITIALIQDDHSHIEYMNTYVSEPKPKEVSRVISSSQQDETRYNIEIAFSNQLKFSIIDGKASATKNGAALNIEGHYRISYDGGIFMISFNQKTSETWYFFEQGSH